MIYDFYEFVFSGEPEETADGGIAHASEGFHVFGYLLLVMIIPHAELIIEYDGFAGERIDHDAVGPEFPMVDIDSLLQAQFPRSGKPVAHLFVSLPSGGDEGAEFFALLLIADLASCLEGIEDGIEFIGFAEVSEDLMAEGTFFHARDAAVGFFAVIGIEGTFLGLDEADLVVIGPKGGD